MKARDVMTANVVTASPETQVKEIAQRLLDHRVSALPVVDGDNRVVGLVSEGDLMRRLEGDEGERRSWWLALLASPREDAADFVKAHGRHAEDVMSREVVTVEEDASVAEIARLLETRRIKRVPVLRDGRLVGIVSRANLLHGLAASKDSLPRSSDDDLGLRQRVARALGEVPGLATSRFNVIARDGAVEVWGIAESEAEEKAARVAVENVDGARVVKIHFGRVPSWMWGF